LIAIAHCEWVRISLSEVRRLNMIIEQATLNRKPRGNAVLLAIVLLNSYSQVGNMRQTTQEVLRFAFCLAMDDQRCCHGAVRSIGTLMSNTVLCQVRIYITRTLQGIRTMLPFSIASISNSCASTTHPRSHNFYCAPVQAMGLCRFSSNSPSTMHTRLQISRFIHSLTF